MSHKPALLAALNLAEKNEKTALMALRNLQQKVAATEKTLEDLQHDKNEYPALFTEKNTLLSPSLVANHHAFIQRLVTMIDEQKKQIASLQLEVVKSMSTWKATHTHQLALKNLIARLDKKQEAIEQLNEQVALDDHYLRNLLLNDL